ncbi:MAG: protein kinase [Deltaproteobacteria bacterium]|nr:protein kinase [Deltaproteobacteria bacterium]
MISCPSCGFSNKSSALVCISCGVVLPLNGVQKEKSDPLIGKQIDNKYEIEEYIGEGGMGRVYRGKQRFLDKLVAIKILHANNLEDERAVAMFYREARLAAKLNHPNSITIYDFGQTEEGIIYMVMEYLRGVSLSSLMKKERSISVTRIASWIRQILLALEAAHRIGLVHRDLKPENIFVEKQQTGSDHVTVLDFGIAKQLNQQDTSLTRPGMVWGTPEYMSPEQATGKQLDERTDLYSLGILFYELLCGRPPFVSENPTEILICHVHEKPQLPSTVAVPGKIPPALEAIIMWAIEKKKDDRISSASEFRRVLEGWLAVSGEHDDGSCPICGNNIPPGSKICPSCLHSINTSERASPVEKIQVVETRDIISVRNLEEDLVVEEESSSMDWMDDISEEQIVTSTLSSVNHPALGTVTGTLTGVNGILHASSSHVIRPLEIATIKKAVTSKNHVLLMGEQGSGRSFAAFNALGSIGDHFLSLNMEETGHGTPWSLERAIVSSVIGLDFISEYSRKLRKQTEYIFSLLECTVPKRNIKTWKLRTRKAIRLFLELKLKKYPHHLFLHGLENISDYGFLESLSTTYRNFSQSLLVECTNSVMLKDAVQINFEPLTEDDSCDLFSQLSKRDVPSQVRNHLSLLEGNVLMLLQYVDLACEEHIPANLSSPMEVLEVRFNRLPTRMRELLEISSMLDEGLSSSEFSTILDTDINTLNMPLELLSNRGLLYKRDDSWYIPHPMLKKVIKGMIPGELRKEFCQNIIGLHERGTVDISPAICAELYFEAGEYVRAFELFNDTSHSFLLCEEGFSTKIYLEKAIDSFRRHLLEHGEIFKQDVNKLHDCVDAYVNMLSNDGQFEKAENVLLTMLNVLGNEPELHMKFLMFLFYMYVDQGELEKAMEVFKVVNSLSDVNTEFSDVFLSGVLKMYAEKGDDVSGLSFISDNLNRILASKGAVNVLISVSESAKNISREMSNVWLKSAQVLAERDPVSRIQVEEVLYRTHLEEGDVSGAIEHLRCAMTDYEKLDMKVELFEAVQNIFRLSFGNNHDETRHLVEISEGIVSDLDWYEARKALNDWKEILENEN